MAELFQKDGYSEKEIMNYLMKHYDYIKVDYYFQEAELRQGTAEEVNAYIDKKFTSMRYSEYVGQKIC